MKTLIAGRYRLKLTEIDATGHRSPPSSGEIELSSRNNSVHGIIGECPILDGSWSTPLPPHNDNDNDDNKTIHNNDDSNNSMLTFTLLYNGSLPFEYNLNTSTGHGTWQFLQSDSTTPLLPDQHGTLHLSHFHLLESSTTITTREFLSTSTPANHACHIRHTSSLPIPCPSCDNDDGSSSRLSFFDMVVPQFGRAELVSLSCGVCLYRENKLRTVEEPKSYGVTLRLEIGVGGLDAVVVLTDAAVVKCDVLELEMRCGAGKISNVEGVLRGCVAALKNAGIFTDEEGGDEIGQFGNRVNQLIEECRCSSSGGSSSSFVIEIDDPLGLSYLEGADVIKWERSQEQNEELGLVGAVTVMSDDGVDNPFMNKSSKVLGSNDDDDTKRLLRHCEAMAAEFTREYEGYDHKTKNLLQDEDRESTSLVESICDYAGCD